MARLKISNPSKGGVSAACQNQLVLKKQQTRKTEPFQQGYYMCQENHLLFWQEHGFLKRILTIVSYGGILAMCKQHSHIYRMFKEYSVDALDSAY